MTPQRVAFVAAYIGEARGNASEAARIAGYKHPGQEGHRLLKNDEIASAIQEWRDDVKQRGIANLEYRVNRLDQLEQKYFDLIEARRVAYQDDAKVIGGDTGLVVKQYKMVGGGENAMLVEEYVADTAVTKAIQSIYDDVAKELGQRVDKVNFSGSLRREYVLVGTDDPSVEVEP